MNIAYLDGTNIDPENQISLYNPSFLYGINCFEGIRAYYNQDVQKLIFFDLNEHINRLYQSSKLINLCPPVNKSDLVNELHEIIKAESISENIYIRITFFISGDTNWADQNNTSYIISIRSIDSNIGNSEPTRLGISKYRRLPSKCMPPHVKAGANYLNSRYALIDCQHNNKDGALFLTIDGYISESTGSCIIFVKEDSLITPSKDCDILFSITRERIIKLCHQSGISISESRISSDEIGLFDAAFLVGTMVEIKPILSINNYKYDVNNSLLQKVSKLFHSYVYS